MNKHEMIIQIKNFVTTDFSDILTSEVKILKLHALTSCGLVSGEVLSLEELQKIVNSNGSNLSSFSINPFACAFKMVNATEEIYNDILPLKNVEIFTNNSIFKFQYLILFHDQITGITATP
ncbi:MAG: hypothetical protein ACRC3I_11855 [Cetobacterium sp.]